MKTNKASKWTSLTKTDSRIKKKKDKKINIQMGTETLSRSKIKKKQRSGLVQKSSLVFLAIEISLTRILVTAI